MNESNDQLASSLEQIVTFSGKNLASRISALELNFLGLDKSQMTQRLTADSLNGDLLSAARTVKRAAIHVDAVLHGIGILVVLPSILKDNEKIEALSLGTESSEEKRFDVETNLRIAEFTFIDWRGNHSTRLQKIFKDFYRLAEFKTKKAKELWVTDETYVLKYLRSGSSIRTATNTHRGVWEGIHTKYPAMERVNEYYELHSETVAVKTLP